MFINYAAIVLYCRHLLPKNVVKLTSRDFTGLAECAALRHFHTLL